MLSICGKHGAVTSTEADPAGAEFSAPRVGRGTRTIVRVLARVGAAGLVPTLVLGAVLGSPAPVQARGRRAPPVAVAAKPVGCGRFDAMCCTPGSASCVRPGPARVLLLSLGAIAGAGAAGLLFALGDRLSNGDAATLLVGGGAVAGAGALLGILAARTLGDGPRLEDRVRRETFGLAMTGAGTRVLGERSPPSMSLRVGPTLWLDERSRVRLLGEVTGLLGAERHVDPRPQLADAAASGSGTQPGTLARRHLGFALGLDFAVGLPYPILRRSARLGQTELRYRPEVQFRRDWITMGDADTRIVEHTMLLPLLVGARWHVSPRQRFTLYVGPRFDIISYSSLDGRRLSRGKPNIAPIYGEAWYDIDVPLTEHPRRDGATRRAKTTGMLSVGYVHSRFGGRGFNFGPVIGFLGPIHAEWTVRVRPVGAKAAAQIGAGIVIGNGYAVTATVGAVLPSLRGRSR